MLRLLQLEKHQQEQQQQHHLYHHLWGFFAKDERHLFFNARGEVDFYGFFDNFYSFWWSSTTSLLFHIICCREPPTRCLITIMHRANNVSSQCNLLSRQICFCFPQIHHNMTKSLTKFGMESFHTGASAVVVPGSGGTLLNSNRCITRAVQWLAKQLNTKAIIAAAATITATNRALHPKNWRQFYYFFHPI